MFETFITTVEEKQQESEQIMTQRLYIQTMGLSRCDCETTHGLVAKVEHNQLLQLASE